MYTQRPLTEQERIDQATMRIDNPNVCIVGSGFIQHPPQRPFERPLQVQPPTVSHLDFPEEYRNVPGLQPGVVPSQPAAAAPPPAHHHHYPHAGGGGGGGGHSNGGAPGGRGGGGRGGGHAGAPGGGVGGRGAPPARPTYRQVPAELLRAPAPPPRPGALASNGAPAARPPPPRPVAAATVAPAAAAAVPSSPRNDDGTKLSKAQKQRLRKKMREGK